MISVRNLTLCAIFLATCMLSGCKGDLSTPKGAAKTFATAMENGDVEAAKRATTGGDPAIIESMVKLTGNMKKLRDAAISKFGDEGKTAFGAGHGESMDLSKSVDDADVKEDGDTATLTPKGEARPLKMKKVSGDWKVDASELTGAMGNMGSAMFDNMSKAAAETADDIKAGKYKTAQEAQQAFGSKMAGSSLGKLQTPDQPK
jgi:hypothetical protein